MSRAFVRESDEAPEEPFVPPPSTQLPPGTKNYLTADGAQRFREELEQLSHETSSPQRDQRLRWLTESLRTAVVVDPLNQSTDRVRFGCSVTARDSSGTDSVYRIVGVDEIDLDRGWISWLSPIVRALMKAKVGDVVKFRSPTGEEKLTIVRIENGL
jgi:transcription elongation factor GreB